jgi:phosphonate degradation associated HDIG domain protein
MMNEQSGLQKVNIEDIASEVISLFEKYGDEDYDGEPVSQTSHMVQAAMQAANEDADAELIIGAFLHDIGHLLKHEMQTEAMGDYGVVNHEGIGAQYLRDRGFSERICSVVENHVQAKRYLVSTDENYYSKLSPASIQTLRWQGGPMSIEEVARFESHPFFNDIIKVRLWDEGAKDTVVSLIPLPIYRKLLIEYLTDIKK